MSLKIMSNNVILLLNVKMDPGFLPIRIFANTFKPLTYSFAYEQKNFDFENVI